MSMQICFLHVNYMYMYSLYLYDCIKIETGINSQFHKTMYFLDAKIQR